MVANTTIVTNVPVGGSTFTMRYGTVTTAYNSWPSSTTCSFSLDPTSASFAASGGPASMAVNTQAGCTWSAHFERKFYDDHERGVSWNQQWDGFLLDCHVVRLPGRAP